MFNNGQNVTDTRRTRVLVPIVAAGILILAAPVATALPTAEQAVLGAGDPGPRDSFGNSVSMSGDTVLVGADHRAQSLDGVGSVYVWVRDGITWTQQAKLSPLDGAFGDAFGWSVSVWGDTALIGARRDDDAGDSSGSAYVFVRNGGIWTQQAKLTAFDADVLDGFGFAVALDGDTALVGSPGDDDAGSVSGSAYVFTRNGSVWTPQAKLTALDAGLMDEFGFSVSLSGSTALIGARFDDHAGSGSGSAYVFTRTGSVWTQQEKLVASDAASGDAFGWSVAVSGDDAVVGAPFDGVSNSDVGAAYVFTRSGTSWSEQTKLVASDASAFELYGFAVGILGDAALVGAPVDNDSKDAPGSTYLYTRDGTVWTEHSKLVASNGENFQMYGNSISMSGDSAVIGAPDDDEDGPGQAYVLVPAPEEKIEALIAAVEALQTAGILNKGQAQGIIRPLENALRSLDNGKLLPACSQLFDFILGVGELIDDGILSLMQGQPLIDQAELCRQALGCP